MDLSTITFADLKAQIKDTQNLQHRYDKFLDELIKYDRRGKDESWDLWYFSINTDMCLKFAESFLQKIIDLDNEEKEFLQGLKKESKYNFNDIRMFYGSFCMYLFAALESFAHEINIFYEINLKRSAVGIKSLAILFKTKRNTLASHLQIILTDRDFKMLFEYRNTIVHGYVYPMLGIERRLLLKNNPRVGRFSFDEKGFDVIEFCSRIFPKTREFIKAGWKCFTKDELT
jgi:hypothetical protein